MGTQARLDAWSGRRRRRSRDSDADARGRPDPGLPPGTHRVPQVRHVVLLMMENHSFDNYLGTLGRGDGLPDPAPVNYGRDGRPVPAHPFRTTRQTPLVPSQSWRASHTQYGGGANDGFVTSVEDLDPGADHTLGMGHWTAQDLPFYAGLAATFPVADRWFCSCLGPTFPNRRFLLAATANGLIDDMTASLIDYPKSGTIFDLLDCHGIDWANYHHVGGALVRQRLGGSGGLRAGRAATSLVRGFLPGLDHRIRGDLQCSANVYPLGLTRTLGHLRGIQHFFDHAAAGTLPAVSVVDPDFSANSEENPQDIQLGEGFAAAVVDAVMRGPGWPHTLLLWFYDEHGGYYDHVPPPAAVVPDAVAPHSLLDRRGLARWVLRHTVNWSQLRAFDGDGDGDGARYDRLGFRVPAVVVSPHARPGVVSSTVFDHTSALRLIEEIWNLPPLTARDAAATAPWDLLDLASAPAFLTPPTLPAPARAWTPPASAGRSRPSRRSRTVT